MLSQQSSLTKQLPLQMVCSCKFGRYPKISEEKVYNMFISDDWLINCAGHKIVENIEAIGNGRAIFNSSRYNHLIAVIDENVYTIDSTVAIFTRVGGIASRSGDVFIAENDAKQIAICDKQYLYIYDYGNNTFEQISKSALDLTPGYVEFQDGYFIVPDLTQPIWALSESNNGKVWPGQLRGRFQTKADNPVACVRAPGRGNTLFVMGKIVTEVYQDVGYQIFPYQRNTGINIDYGCVSSSTIAASDTFLIWLGSNEKSGLSIMATNGGEVKTISTDGINYLLTKIKYPESSYGFLFKQDGHLLYQLTFSDPRDNITILYDFNTNKFFFLCDENMNHHIAKRMAFFNNSYYFVSFNDGNLYESNSSYTTYDGKEIPRIVICPTTRLPDTSPFIVNDIEFLIEEGAEVEKSFYTDPVRYMGDINTSADFPSSPTDGDYYKIISPSVVDDDPAKTNTGKSFVPCDIVWNSNEGRWDVISDMTPRVDVSISIDGGVSFSNYVGMYMNQVAYRKNKFVMYGLGYCNEFTPQFRLWGTGRYIINNGVINIYQ